MSLFVEIYSQGKVHALFFGIADFLAPTKSDAFFLGTFPSTRSGQRKISKKSDDFFFLVTFLYHNKKWPDSVVVAPLLGKTTINMYV